MGSELLSGFGCSVCGERHELPLSYSVKAPMAAAAVPMEEMEQRIVFTPDQCVIDGKDFYLRGRILVPVIGVEEPFVWGASREGVERLLAEHGMRVQRVVTTLELRDLRLRGAARRRLPRATGEFIVVAEGSSKAPVRVCRNDSRRNA